MNTRAWVCIALLVAGALGAYYFWPSSAAITNYPSSGTDIIAFGDSLILGVGASEGRDLVSLLSQKIGVPVVNLGVSGDKTADGLARLEALDTYNPKVVILLLGGNDYLKRVPTEETFRNLAEIIKDIQGRGAIVVLLGVRGGLFGDHFAGEYKKVSRAYHTAYVPNVLDGLLGDPKYMSDEIHPNDAGYNLIAERVSPVIKRLLQ